MYVSAIYVLFLLFLLKDLLGLIQGIQLDG